MTGPYSSAATGYWQAGWRGILPLPAKKKTPPPGGFTGESGTDPSYADIWTWTEDTTHGAGNIALRLPRDVIGLDVDDYGDKTGGATYAAAESRWGALPPTWRTTSRDDGISGIRLYRVPEGLAWPGELGKDTEIIQHRHRYAVVCPSVHPEGRTYHWINPAGVVSTGVPDPDELPTLPAAWVEGLTGGALAEQTLRGSLSSAQTGTWLVTQPGATDAPCSRMRKAIEQSATALRNGSAHAAARDGALRVIRLGSEGHPGLAAALADVQRQFQQEATGVHRTALGKRRRTDAEARKEWNDLVTSAVNLVTANPSPAPTCDCYGQLTHGLLTPVSGPTVEGSSALAPLVTLDEPNVAADATPTADAAVERTSWWPKPLAGILAGREDEPAPTHLARDDGHRLFYRGKVNGLLGESESGKTWVALLAVADALADGQQVLYLDFEDTAQGIVGRLRALSATDEQLALLHYIGPEETLHVAASGDLRETLEQVRPELVVLDGFNAAMTLLGLDLDNNKDATQFAQVLLRPLAATGACVVYVDHVPKNKDNRGKGGIGAQAKRAMTTGCAVTVDVLSPFGRGMTGRLKLTVDKDRPGHVRAVSEAAKNIGIAVLTSYPATQTVTVRIEAAETPAEQPSAASQHLELMERLSGWLVMQPERTSKRAAAKAVRARPELVGPALDELVRLGHVERDGTNHVHVSRFSVAQTLETGVLPTASQVLPGSGGMADASASGKHPLPTGGASGGGASSGTTGTGSASEVLGSTHDVAACRTCGEVAGPGDELDGNHECHHCRWTR